MFWWMLDIIFSEIVIYIVQKMSFLWRWLWFFCVKLTATVRTAGCCTCGFCSLYFFCLSKWLNTMTGFHKKICVPLQTCCASAVLCKVWDNTAIQECTFQLTHRLPETHSALCLTISTLLLPPSRTFITRMYRQLISDSCLITHSYTQTHIVSLCHLAWNSCRW